MSLDWLVSIFAVSMMLLDIIVVIFIIFTDWLLCLVDAKGKKKWAAVLVKVANPDYVAGTDMEKEIAACIALCSGRKTLKK